VAVIRSSWTFIAAPLLEGKGIAALVNISEAPQDVVPHFTARLYPSPLRAPWTGRVFPFPGVTIDAAAGQRLLSLMSVSQVRVRVEHRAQYVEKTAANIVGEIVGEVAPDERVILAAHYDTQLEGPGAQDNGSGLAVLLELATAWSRLRLPRTVVFIAMALEEQALWGAHAYVTAHPDDHARTLGMINIDSPGSPLPGTRSMFVDPAMAAFVRESAARTRWPVEAEFDASQYPTGDHIPFIESGVPACWLNQSPPKSPYYHTVRDTIDFVSFPRAKQSGTASAYIAFRLVHLPTPGFGRSRPSRRWAAAPSS
jgi:hypothetical protein